MASVYPSDLTDAQWSVVEEIFDPPRPRGGRPRVHEVRHLVNAILYLTKEGCRYRAIPRDFPPWQTVATARRRWIIDGTLERATSALARAQVRPHRWLSLTLPSSKPATAERNASCRA